MFELDLRQTFSAAHAIVMNGVREPVHGHDWCVTVTVTADELDDDGLVCDFHALERLLEQIIDPFRNRCFNDVAPFDQRNPSAERIVQFIAESLIERLPHHVRVQRVQITEAPGCVARYVVS